jgi:hypothetical protein
VTGGAFLELQEVQQSPDVVTELRRMPHFGRAVHHVMVPTADTSSLEEAGLDQLRDDPLDGTFGDADVSRDIPQTNARVARDAEQDLRVVRDEGPALR